MSPPGHASKQALGNEAPNSVRPPNATVYLQLQYLAPDEAQPRNFPPQFPITVRWGEDVDPPGASTHEETYRTTADGRLQFPARVAEGKPWKKFTLRFQAVSANQPRYIYVEKRGDALHPGFTTDLADVISRETPNRFFKIPNQWSLKQSDWDLGKEKFGDNGKYTKASGTLEHTKRGKGRNKNAPRDIGTSAKPVQLVLNPHWKFVRFEFFDRYYGPTFGDPARDGHGKRIGTPQLVLEGFRNKLDPALADLASTRSNWVIGADEDNLLQCLPFILRKAADGKAFEHTGANLGLRFVTTQEADKRTYIVSESKAARKLKHLGKNSPPASPPGPERLKAYDLPKVWKAKNWFVRETPSSPPAAGKFYDKLDAAAITKADSKNTPLIFCLDDLVLTDDSFVQYPIEAEDRVAVFWHTFSPPGAPGADFSALGVYKPGADPHWHGYPYSDIQMPMRHYITNYPDWTRLVVAQGNLFDAFSERTTDVAENTVVGARAAVRWTWVTSPPNAAPLGTNKGAPGARTDKTYAAIQPFWRQAFAAHSDNPQRNAIHHDEWAGAFSPPSPYYIGRFDLAHLRCTDWHGADEVTTVMRYIRYGFDLGMVNTCPPVVAPYASPEMWAKEALDNIMARWNAGDAFNPGRPWITPKPSPPQEAPPLRAQVITLVQYVSPPACHFRIRTVAPTQGSFVNSAGDAQFRVNSIRHDAGGGVGSLDDWNKQRWAVPGRGLAAAHETGHAGAMPDEYPYSNPSECIGYKFLHIPANPFQYDFSNAHSCLMKGNGVIRTHYFWHAAEWLHSLPGLGGTNWKIEHGNNADYSLPHYQWADAQPGRSYCTWPVRFNLRQRNPGQNHLFDSFLYFLGQEEYTTAVLPAPVDGMLVVVLRMYLHLDAVDAADRETISEGLHERVQTRMNALNQRFRANFQVYPGARRKPDFQNCLLQFVPAVNVRGASDASTGATAARLETASRHHLFIAFQEDGPAMWPLNVNEWTESVPANPNRLVFRFKQADWDGYNNANITFWLNAAADVLYDCCLTTLGLPTAGPGGFDSPPSYRHIVRTVMANGAPNPVIT